MKLRIFRWLLASGAWIFCASEFKSVLSSGGGIGGAPALWFGFGAFISGLLLVTPEIITPISGFFAEYRKIIPCYLKEKNAYREILLVAQEVGDERTFQRYTRRYLRHFGELLSHQARTLRSANPP